MSKTIKRGCEYTSTTQRELIRELVTLIMIRFNFTRHRYPYTKSLQHMTKYQTSKRRIIGIHR